MHQLIASLAVRTGIDPGALADLDGDLFDALVRRVRGDDRDVLSDVEGW